MSIAQPDDPEMARGILALREKRSSSRDASGSAPFVDAASAESNYLFSASTPVCSGVAIPGGSSMILMLRKWISAPSDSRQR